MQLGYTHANIYTYVLQSQHQPAPQSTSQSTALRSLTLSSPRSPQAQDHQPRCPWDSPRLCYPPEHAQVFSTKA